MLNNIIAHLTNKLKRVPKIIIWAHNSHLGNAKATEMSSRGELNLGQLIKEAYPPDSFSLGFSTYTGVVTAADNWNGEPKFKKINPALPDSYEFLFHSLPAKNFLFNFNAKQEIKELFSRPKLQRAIGVVYYPDTERQNHYFMAKASLQFDTMLHIDYTNHLHPPPRIIHHG